MRRTSRENRFGWVNISGVFLISVLFGLVFLNICSQSVLAACEPGQCVYGNKRTCYDDGATRRHSSIGSDNPIFVCRYGTWLKTNGYKCSKNSECDSGYCIGGTCCNAGQCGYSTKNGGKCYNDGELRGDSIVCRSGVWKDANGQTCSKSSECASGYCINGVCCDTNQCGYLNKNGGYCFDVGETRRHTSIGSDNPYYVCMADGSWKKDYGYMCNTDGECSTGRCIGGVCCNSGQCGKTSRTSGRCYDVGGGYMRSVIGSNTYYVCVAGEVFKKDNGYECSKNSECVSGHCIGGACCNADQCGYANKNGGRCYDTGEERSGFVCYMNEWYYNGKLLAHLENASRVEKDLFKCCCYHTFEPVYLDICLYSETPPSTSIDPKVYVVPAGSYPVGSKIPSDVTERVEVIDIPTTCSSTLRIKIWDEPTPGNYQVILDLDEDGIIDKSEVLGALEFEVYYCECQTPKGSLKIKKTCENCDKIEGIEFTVTGPDNFYQQVTTNSQGIAILDDLEYGTYTLTESVPTGYAVTSQNPQQVVIDSESQELVTFSNKIPKGKLRIKKILEGCNNPMSGATFEVTGPAGFGATVTTNSQGIATLDNLNYGTYTITEIVPEGYVVVSQNPQQVLVTTETEYLVTFKNRVEEHPKGKIKIIKTQECCGNPMEGIEFTITGPNNFLTTVVTDSNGIATLEDLDYGTYTITETVPAGFVCVSDNPQILVVNSEDWEIATFVNREEETPKGSLKIKKLCEGCQNSTGGVNFTVQVPNGTNISAITNVSGLVVLDGLEFGTYTITEIVPEGYTCISDNPQEVTIDSETTFLVTFTNEVEEEPKGSLKIKKLWENCSAPVINVNFTVEGPEGFYEVVSVNGSGYTHRENLSYGNYLITEIVPEGYIVTTNNPQSVTINAETQFVVTFINEEEGETPKGSLRILKKVLDDEIFVPMEGVNFTIIGSGGYSRELTTDSSGEAIIENLEFGSYVVTEIVPEGYIALSENPQVVVINSTEQETVLFKNKPETPPTNPKKTVGWPKTLWDGSDAIYYDIADRCWNGESDSIDCWKVTLDTPISMECVDDEENLVDAEMCFRVEWDADDITQKYCTEYDGDYDKYDDGYCCLDEAIEEFYFTEETEHNLAFYCVNSGGEKSDLDDEKFKVEGETFEIEINKKWNLISVPFVMPEDSIEEVFSDIEGDIISVSTYNADTDTWLIYTPSDSPDTLTEMVPGWGYWVLAKRDTTLRISGSLFSPVTLPPSRELYEGWNIIGYYGTEGQDGYYGPANSGKTAYNALYSLVDSHSGAPMWTSLVTYWEPENPSQWVFFGLEDRLDPGAGYLIFLTEDATYTPSSWS